jgi:hypothetical protein
MANEEEWQRQLDERMAELGNDVHAESISTIMGRMELSARLATGNMEHSVLTVLRKLRIKRIVVLEDEPKVPSTALINLLFSVKKAKDIKANLTEVYNDIWVPENGPRWAKVMWYTHTLAIRISTAFAPVMDALERMKKFVGTT